MKRAPVSLLRGQSGVWQVASQLALRGMNPHFPGVDFGYDLTVDGGLRLQVKMAGRRHGTYNFKFWQSNILSGASTIRRRGARDYSQDCDFVVLWGVDENRFWIVPAVTIAKTQSLQVGPEGFYQRNEFAQTKALQSAGLSQREIGQRLGISQVAVSYQLRGGRKTLPKRTVSAQVRELENRWDLITTALAAPVEARRVMTEGSRSAVSVETTQA